MLPPLGFILSPFFFRGASTMQSKHPCSSAFVIFVHPKHEWQTIHLHISTFHFKFQPCNHYVPSSAKMLKIIPPIRFFVQFLPVNCIGEVTPWPSLFCLKHDFWRPFGPAVRDQTKHETKWLKCCLTILYLLRTSPHHFKSHHYHQDPDFIFVMTTILFLTAGCQAFIHTLTPCTLIPDFNKNLQQETMEIGLRLGSTCQLVNSLNLSWGERRVQHLFDSTGRKSRCTSAEKLPENKNVQNSRQGMYENIYIYIYEFFKHNFRLKTVVTVRVSTLVILSFLLFWQTIHNKWIKGMFFYNLRNISTAPPSCPPGLVSSPRTRISLHQYHASRTNSNDIRPLFCMSSLANAKHLVVSKPMTWYLSECLVGSSWINFFFGECGC